MAGGGDLGGLKKVERLAVMEVRPGGEQAGAGLLTGTAILGER